MIVTGDVLRPDPRLRRPARPLPRGTVDCHAHIFDRFERYPLSAGRKYSPPLCTREAWMALHAALGVERGVQVHGSPYGFDNSITEDFLKEYRGRFVGVAAIGPDIPEEKLKQLDGSGFRAARLMDQFATGATTKDLEAIAARVAPYGWHIEINIAKSADWVELEPRLKRCPVPLVFDHLGRVRGGEGVNAPGFKVILRLLDALQMNAKHGVATPVNWKPGQDVIIPTSVSDEEAKKKYPGGFKTLKPYLRVVAPPK